MSSYLNIYMKDEGNPMLIGWFSRNHPVYQAFYEHENVTWIGSHNCKEWYAEIHDKPDFKHVDTKEEAVYPIPENKEHDDFIKSGKKDYTKIPRLVYFGYFIKEEYDSLPTKNEMILNCTHFTKDDLESLINILDAEYNKAKESFKDSKLETIIYTALDKVFPEKKIEIPEEEDYQEYLDELTLAINQISFLTYNTPIDAEFYCYVD